MTTLAVRHTVQDFDTWKTAFDAHEAVRRGHGASGHRVLRDGQDILVLIDFDTQEQAGAFTADPSRSEPPDELTARYVTGALRLAGAE